MNIPPMVRDKVRALPDKPGCYLMRDGRGRIIYVGKAASLRKRVQSYFREATLRHAAPKLRGLVASVRDLDHVVVRNEAEAILTEGRLIKEYKPRYNVSFRDDKRFLLLRADGREPFPVFTVCRIRREDGAAYFGPYASSAAPRATLDFVEKRFGIRKCAPRIPDAETYRHCINDIVRYCSAPCIGKATPDEYRHRFEEACAFLRGERPGCLNELRESMGRLAAEQKFEQAAAVRDTLFFLQETVRQRARVAATPEMRREDAKAGVSELRTLLELARAPDLIEAFDISTISGTYSVGSMVCAVEGVPRRNRYRRFRIRTVEGLDDPGMMAEVVRRRYTRLKTEGGRLPDLVLVDGGIAQLRAARAELKRLDLAQVAVAGLAKRFEEIYWRNSGAPLRLPGDSRALHVLQRIRDEAHRFALDYHRRMRSRRIRESALDEIPSIGSKRKELLLKHFGSVRRLLRATEKQLAEVPGIGYEMAKDLRERLRSVSGDADSGQEGTGADSGRQT